MTTKPKREAEMETEIRALTKLSKNAEKARAFGAAVTARAKVGELRTRLGRMRAEREADAELDPVKRVQRLRRLATEAGSYVAASNLSKLEDKLVEAREAAARAAAGDGFEDMSDADLVGIIESAIIALPDTLVIRVREAAEARLEGRRLRVVGGSGSEG
jgi:hypothetical protein